MDSNKTPDDRVALIDLDGTCADYDGAMVKELNKIRCSDEPELDHIPYGMVPPYLEHRIDLIKRQTGFWSSLPVIPIGLDVCRLLKENLGFELMVLTKGPKRTTSAWSEKVEWSTKHLPYADVTVTHNKGLVYGKVLFDDFPPYILGWLAHRPRGKVLMLDSGYNEGFEHPNVLRIKRFEILQEDQVAEISSFLARKSS